MLRGDARPCCAGKGAHHTHSQLRRRTRLKLRRPITARRTHERRHQASRRAVLRYRRRRRQPHNAPNPTCRLPAHQCSRRHVHSLGGRPCASSSLRARRTPARSQTRSLVARVRRSCRAAGGPSEMVVDASTMSRRRRVDGRPSCLAAARAQAKRWRRRRRSGRGRRRRRASHLGAPSETGPPRNRDQTRTPVLAPGSDPMRCVSGSNDTT